MISHAEVLRLRSSWRHFLAHRAQLALALIGVATGVAAVIAVGLARHSVQAAFDATTTLLSGRATHTIVADSGRIPLDAYAQLRRSEGAIPMAPRLRATILNADGEPWTLLGVDLTKEDAFQRAGSDADEADSFPTAAWFAGENWLVLPADAASPGSTWAFSLGEVAFAASVAATYAAQSPGAGRVAVADIAAAQRWLGAGTAIDAVDVIASEGQVERLAGALPAGLSLVSTDGGEKGLTRAFDLNLTALSLLTALVGAFIVFNTFNFLVLQRRALFELEHRLGVPRQRQRRQVLIESMAIGIVGSSLGIVAGIGLGTLTLGVTRRTISNLYYDVSGASLEIAAPILAIGFAVGLASCLAAAAWPARQLAVEASRRTPAWLLPALFGVTCVGVALLLLPTRLLGALAGVFLAAVGYAALGAPLLARFLDRWVRTVPFRGRPIPGLSLRRLPRSLDRMLPAITALTLAVATVIGVGTMIDSFRDTVGAWLEESLSADFYVAADRSPLTREWLAAARTGPGVREIARFASRRAEVSIRPDASDAASVTTSIVISDVIDDNRGSYRFRSGSVAAFDADPVLVLSEALARRLGVTAGDVISVETAAGVLAGPVGGVIADYRAGGGRIMTDWSSWAGRFDAPEPTSIGLYLDAGASVDRLGAYLAGLAPARDDVRLADTVNIRRDSLAIFDQTFQVTRALQWIAAIVALVGLTGSLLALQLDRRDELRLLDTLGVGPAYRRRSLRIEALMIGAAVSVFALPLGALLAWALTAVINLRAFGWTLSPDLFGPSLALGPIVALLGAWIAGAIAARLEAR